MRAMPTGSAEFIGKYLSDRILGDGWDVIGIEAIRLYYDLQPDVPGGLGETFAWYVHENVVEAQRVFEAVLAEDLAVGRFDPRLLAQLAGWLASFAYVHEIPDVFSHDPDRQIDQWDRCLRAHTTDLVARLDAGVGDAGVGNAIEESGVGNKLVDDLCRLRLSSERVLTGGFRNLDLRAVDIRTLGAVVGRAELDGKHSLGDPALDLGVLLGSLLRVGIQRGVPARCQLSVHEVTRAYRETAPDVWASSAARAVAFAGATMLRDASDSDVHVRAAASVLLGIDHDESARASIDLLHKVLGSAPPERPSRRDHDLPAERRRISRRSLRTENAGELVEGSVATLNVASEIVVEVVGGRPFEELEVFFDGSLARTLTLDSNGAASEVCEFDEVVHRVEVRRGSETVLSTMNRVGFG
jgi:hypothetical protein